MLQSEGADYLAVALPVEGVELRRNGISLPILVLTAGTDFFPEIISYRLEPGIPQPLHSRSACKVLRGARRQIIPRACQARHRHAPSRLMPDELPALERFLKEHDEVSVKSSVFPSCGVGGSGRTNSRSRRCGLSKKGGGWSWDRRSATCPCGIFSTPQASKAFPAVPVRHGAAGNRNIRHKRIAGREARTCGFAERSRSCRSSSARATPWATDAAGMSRRAAWRPPPSP